MSQRSFQEKKSKLIKTLKSIQNSQSLTKIKRQSFASIANTPKRNSKRMDSFHDVYMKAKANNLVRLFIYKMKRIIKSPVPIQYQIIQQNLVQKQNHNVLPPLFKIPDWVKTIFIIINIFSIFILQIFSISGALLKNFNKAQYEPTVVTMKIIIIIVFLIKNIFNFTVTDTFNQSVFKKVQNLKYKNSQFWIFIFDILLLIMSVLILSLKNELGVGVTGFSIALLSFSGFNKRLQFIQITYVDSFKKKQYYDLCRILLFNICSLQIFIAIIIAMTHYDAENNWINKSIRNNNIRPDPTWWQVYIYSTYLTIATLQTVGFGDMIQSNYLEALTFIPVVFFGYFAFVYNVSQVANIISNLRNIDAQKNQDTAIFKRMVKKQQISYELQQQVLNYIDQSALIKSKYEFQQRKNLLQKLPQELRQEYQMEASKHIFAKIPFFKMLQSKTLIALSQQIQGKIFYPTEYLTQNAEKLTDIMILKHGKVGYAYCRQYSEINGVVLQSRTINEDIDNPYLLNHYFLVPDKEINYHVIASTYCFLYLITFEKFKNCLKMNSKDNQFYFQMCSKLSYIEQQEDTQVCQYCDPCRHSRFQCPRLHYMPYRGFVIYKNIFRKVYNQTRKTKFKRQYGSTKRSHTLFIWVKQFRQLKTQQKNKIIRKRKISWLEVSTQMEKKHNNEQTNEETYNYLMERLNQQFLATRFELNYEYNINIDFILDRMHNFSNYFPDQNPSRLAWTSLNQQGSQPPKKVI